MELIYLDNLLFEHTVVNKSRCLIKEEEIKAILSALGFGKSFLVELSDYQDGEFNKILGNGCSFSCCCYYSESKTEFRIGKYTNGKVVSLLVSTDTIDEVYSIQDLEGKIKLTLKGYGLKGEDGFSISKKQRVSECVYEVRYADYLFSCSFNLDKDSSELLKEFEFFLIKYLRELRFPLQKTIIDIYKEICDICSLSPKLKVTKGDVLTDKIEFGLEDDDYSVLVSKESYSISCSRANATYKKFISIGANSSNQSPYMYVCVENAQDEQGFNIEKGQFNSGFSFDGNCDSAIIGQYCSHFFATDLFSGRRAISSLQADLRLEVLPIHSKYIKKK